MAGRLTLEVVVVVDSADTSDRHEASAGSRAENFILEAQIEFSCGGATRNKMRKKGIRREWDQLVIDNVVFISFTTLVDHLVWNTDPGFCDGNQRTARRWSSPKKITLLLTAPMLLLMPRFDSRQAGS